jgi:anti-anti-sigma factor
MSLPPSSEAFSISVEPSRRDVAIVPAGGLDLTSVALVDREVRELFRAGFEQVVIDLRRVTSIDSAALRGLVELRNLCRRTAHSLALVAGPPEVHRLFTVTGTFGLFDWSHRF